MRRLCFGGSFNPIHHAHLICARAVAEARGFNEVVLIPSAQPPHKPDAGSDLAAPEQRLEMCRLALSDTADMSDKAAKAAVRFSVDDVELRRSGPSYTIHTAGELKGRGWETVSWLIGADMLLYLPKWHRPLDLLAEVEFLVMARPGWEFDWSTLPAEYRSLEANVVAAPLLDISATEIRRRVGSGLSIDYLTTPGVVRYIADHALYRGE
jgi:nicotinate-nucleotide adenylyltransferase